MSDETYLTTDEVQDMLRVDLRTVYRLIKRGELPAIRVGRQWRFRRADVEAWHRSPNGRLLSGAAPRRRRVLIVDDEEPIRNLLSRSFAQANYDVDAASDGVAAIERLRETEYDLIVTDLQMPGLGGLSVIREARRRASPWELPILIVTGRSTEASAIEAINLGVSGYVTKPFRMPAVLAAAARALGDAPAGPNAEF